MTENPAAQKVAKGLAANPAVQNAVKNEVKKEIMGGSSAPPPPPVAPGWASEKSTPTSPSAKKDVENQKPTEAVTDYPMEAETLAQMGKYHLFLRLMYIAAAIFMSFAAALSLAGQSDLGKAFFAIYVMIFCTLICCFEAALSAIARVLAINFGFLYTMYGRLAFILFICFMSYSLGLLGLIAMCVMLVVMCYHFFIIYKFPRFEEYLRKKHYYEGRREASQQK